jgi:hemoglobin
MALEFVANSKKEENLVMSIIKRIVLAFCLIGALAVAATAQEPMNAPMGGSSGSQMKKSLYDRLGGYDAIAAVVDDFIGRLATDPRFTRFFTGFSTDSKKRLRQHILDQFCVAAGGPCVYMGRDMKTSHAGLGITEADWDAAAKHLVESLDRYKVPKAEKDELLAFVGSVKKDIVEK